MNINIAKSWILAVVKASPCGVLITDISKKCSALDNCTIKTYYDAIDQLEKSGQIIITGKFCSYNEYVKCLQFLDEALTLSELYEKNRHIFSVTEFLDIINEMLRHKNLSINEKGFIGKKIVDNSPKMKELDKIKKPYSILTDSTYYEYWNNFCATYSPCLKPKSDEVFISYSKK